MNWSIYLLSFLLGVAASGKTISRIAHAHSIFVSASAVDRPGQLVIAELHSHDDLAQYGDLLGALPIEVNNGDTYNVSMY